MKYITFFFFIPFLIIKSWLILCIDILTQFLKYWKTLNFLFKLSIIFSVLQIIYSIRPWIEYEVMFTENIDRVSVSTKINLYLILLSFLSLFSVTTMKNIIRFKFFLVSETIILVLFLIGIIFPRPILHDFINESDYFFNKSIYIFGISNIITFFLSIRMYHKFYKNS